MYTWATKSKDDRHEYNNVRCSVRYRVTGQDCSSCTTKPHRKGDANVRAVWLFSRTDAIGNAAVVVAAGLVWWTGTPWPDLFVTGIVATLFLQSAWSIIVDARADLKQAKRVV